MSVGERACTYACLILHDDGISITAEKIAKLVCAANVSVESYWPGLFAKLCEKKNLDELIMNIAAAATDEKEWTIGLPKSLPWDTNAEDSSSEGSEDEESKQESMLLKHTPRTIFTREAKEAMKLQQQKCTDWRMNMVNISLPLPPPPPFIPVPRYTPAPLSSTAGYMSPEEEKKQLAEFLEKHPKSSGHDQVTSYLKKKLQKSISLMDQ